MSDNDPTIWETQRNIEYVISSVAKRGWIETPLDIDQFAELRQEARYRDAQIAALYEQYFLPERHETDWQLLSETVQAVVHAVGTSPAAAFAAQSVASGVIGNAAFAIITKMCSYTASQLQLKLGNRAQERASSFKQISDDAETLKSFFQKVPKARIVEIEQATGIPRDKISPMLKIAGFNHHRRGTPCYWELP